MNHKTGLSALLLLLMYVAPAQKVHLKTGNFSVKHTDVEFQAGYKLHIGRVYNSTSNYKSIFGLGWAYDYSKALVVNPDGSLVTKECECEGRTDNVYNPTTFDETVKTDAIEKIATATQSLQPMSPEEVFTYKRKLTDDRGFFIDEWKKLLDKKVMEPYKVATGTKFISKSWGFAVIIKTEDGYTLDAGSIKKYYNNDGLLMKETNGNDFIQLKYNTQNQLVAVEDHINNKIAFTYNNDGLVKRAIASGIIKDTTDYEYKGELLVKVKNRRFASPIQYTYAADDSHLLVKTTGGNNKSTRIAYTEETEKKVKVLLTGKYDSAAYTYTKTVVGDKEYTLTGKELKYYKSDYYDEDDEEEEEEGDTKVAQPEKSNWKLQKQKECTYYITGLADGFQYNYRVITNDNGISEDVYQNEEGDPDKIIKGSDTTFFQYNRYGEIIKKESKEKLEILEYDASCSKILYYKKIDRYYNDTVWRRFEYTGNCELKRVENNEGNKISLEYDGKGKIGKMTDLNDNKSLSFVYNKIGKPIEINGPNGGIKVTYDESGEISKVDSEQGHKMALEVTQMFQKLLSLTKVDNLKPCKCRL